MIPILARTRLGLAAARHALPAPVVLVPTMGALHDGHRALLRRAREISRPNGSVVGSVFVNPLQFGPCEDLDSYPRDEDRDAELAALEGVDLLWTPDTDQMYPDGFATSVEVANSLAGVLEGDPENRGPSPFRGVTTIVVTLAPSMTCHMLAGTRPATSPARPRMKENSPTCASPTPAVAATRRDACVARSDNVATVALMTMIAAAAPSTSGRRSITAGRSTSMPSEMKNRPESMSRIGRTSANA